MYKFILILLLSILFTPISFATQSSNTIDISLSGQLSLYLENDVTYGKTDQYFTHGTRLQYITEEGYGFSLGQNIYTPHNKEATELLPYDRPYAGYLYCSVFNTFYLDNSDNFHIEAQIGIIGPYSYAEQTQIWVHKHLGNKIPKGWANQIYNHFAFLVIGEYTMPVYENKYFAIDPYAGAYLGNLTDYFDIGLNVYAGHNLPSDRSNPRTIPFKGFEDNEWLSYSHVYLYAGLEPKLVLYNMLLEDHRFSIHPETFVYDKNVGAVLGFKDFELAFTLCFRSKEFKEQYKAEQFGSAKISVNF